MPEWLSAAHTPEAPVAPGTLALRLALAVVFGGAVAAIYRRSHGRDKTEATMLSTTLVLLCVLIAMVTQVIGDSVARAFSLVGALSIVRFRTVVEDTRDTAFVIFAVIVGMAVGAGALLVPLLGVPTVGLAAIALARRRAEPPAGGIAATLRVRLGLGHDPGGALREAVSRNVESFRLVEMGTARQGAAWDLTYAVRLRSEEAFATLVSEVNQVEGIQSVELTRH